MPTVINYILQDKVGFLWFATNSGLYKYDGYTFTSYKHDLDDTTSLIDNTVTTLYEDKSGTLWAGTWKGLERFDHINNTFTHYKPGLPDNRNDDYIFIRTICEDKFGKIWIETSDGLFRFNKTTEKYESFKYDKAEDGSISHNSVNVIYEDKEEQLWFGTQEGLDRFDFRTGKFIHYWEHNINTIFKDKDAIIWLGTDRGLVEFNTNENSFTTYLFIPQYPLNRITSIAQDVLTDCLWLATTDGLFSFDIKSKKFTRYNTEAKCVLGERSGTIWLGTDIEIKKINRFKQPFKKYPMDKIVQVVKAGREGTVWVFTTGLEYKKFDVIKEQFVPYSFNGDSLLYVCTSDADLLIHNEKRNIYAIDSSGVKHEGGSLPLEFVKTVCFIWKGKNGYWIGTVFGGLHFFDPVLMKYTEMKKFKYHINYIYEDSIGLLWVAVSGGMVYCYEQSEDTLKELISDANSPLKLNGTEISEIYQDKKGRIWFATNYGLNRYERPANKLAHFTIKDGLPSNSLRGILEDDHGCLWIATTKGISKFNPETNYFKNYDMSYGLEFTADEWAGRGCKTKNGEMYFGGAKGFTRFHPDSIKDNPFIPPIVITSLKTFDKPFPLSGEIYLPYDKNFLSFEFAALSFISPERNQYAYMMEGLDKDWVNSGTRRYASYPNLDPGEYVFRVKGSNNDGVWNEAGASVLIIISPPWWKTWWAYSAYAVLFIFLIYGLRRYDLNRIALENQVKMDEAVLKEREETDKIKSRFFANISHEFRTPLTMILGPVKQIIEILKDDRKSVDKKKIRNELKVVHRNADRLLVLVNQLLDLSKLESGNMKLQTTPQNIIPLLKALLQSFCSYAEWKRIILKFNSPEEEIIVYIDKDKLEKIFINILSNALKFTPEGGEVEVTVNMTTNGSGRPQIKGNYIEISIHDNGTGIPKEKLPRIFDRFYQADGSHTREQEGTGIGLALTKELIDLHKGKIEVESEEGKGTTFKISIPLGKEHLKPEEICEEEKEEEKVLPFPEEKIYPEEKEPEKSKLELAAKAEKPFLLVVEDNFDVRNYLKNYLDKDYRIMEAVDGKDGWSKSIDQIPDLIVSDVMMPKMNGFRLCEKLKTDERTSHIPVILLTAKASGRDKIEGLETGADDYIMKPFELKELSARIKNLIEQRKRIHEHFRKEGLFELEKSKITSIDRIFLLKVVDVINQNISDSSFNVEFFAKNLNISKSLLQKKLVSLTGESPVELIKRIRLKKAAELIEKKFGNISEIALEVGFNNPAYFSESFKKQFGVSPSQYHFKNTSV